MFVVLISTLLIGGTIDEKPIKKPADVQSKPAASAVGKPATKSVPAADSEKRLRRATNVRSGDSIRGNVNGLRSRSTSGVFNRRSAASDSNSGRKFLRDGRRGGVRTGIF